MKIIQCKNIQEYLDLEKRACQHLNIPNKHHDRYAPPPNNNELDFPVAEFVEALFQDQDVKIRTEWGEIVDPEILEKRKRKKKKLKKRVIR